MDIYYMKIQEELYRNFDKGTLLLTIDKAYVVKVPINSYIKLQYYMKPNIKAY